MSELRQRRRLSESSGLESSGLESDDGKKSHRNHHAKHHKHKKQWKLTQSKRFIFFIGIFLGLGIAWYTAQSQDLVSLDMLNEISLDSILDEFRDMLPAGIIREARNVEKQHAIPADSFAVGNHLRDEQGLGVKHPVVLVPGVISTGLESWGITGTSECPSQHYFRKRLWGSWYMLRAMLLDKQCWLRHIMLDPETGLDPPGFKLRAAQGMEAADFFVPGYWIWNKILENLAALGYDVNTMAVAAYDWRLAYGDLERRDRYFSKIKRTIENNLSQTGEKTVLMGHSMGSQVVFYFLKWVEDMAPTSGQGGPDWVNRHIEAFVDISGSTLGTPKAIVALLSGEMKDTVQLNALAVYGLEKFFSRRERADMLRSFGGIASMLPKGGDAIWGTLDRAPDDTQLLLASTVESANATTANASFGNFIRFRNTVSELSSRNMTISESIDFLFDQAPEWFAKRAREQYSNGLARTRKQVKENNRDPSKWVNPLEVALPNAPDMKIYCFYGVGKPTERGYYYQEEIDKNLTNLNITIAQSDPGAVVLGEGDGTISLLTHTMCYRWKEKDSKFNPGNSKVTVVEMLHQPDRLDIRGGAKTAEHVDILGRTELNELVLRVAAGKGDEIEEKLFSSINDWVWDIDLGE
ncbi:phospholipid:diacylglycerol acyltransferase [Trichomonascus vanleenenianus]|uniref:phospholipid:diacylglycerol acyltransferase n=1 Tax=Trichomonascus vanleenenianus TaxID=2268995 RepID=UPI003EC9908D